MKKYWFLIKTQVSLVTAYRFKLLSNWIYRVFQVAVFYFLWSLTTNDTAELGKLLGYFTIVYLFFDPLTTGVVAGQMNKEIQSGGISAFLIKPISFPATQLTKLVTKFIVSITVPLILFIFASILKPEIFAPFSFINLILFLFFTVLGIILWNLFMMILGSIAFWGTDVAALITVTDLILNIFNGRLIPMYLYPEWYLQIIKFTPIPYIGAYQIELYQTSINLNEVLLRFLILIFWIALLYILFRFIYKTGLYKYEALNG